jgi:hypothetical protein
MSRHVSVIAFLACNYLATASLIICSLAIVPIWAMSDMARGWG